MSTEGQEKKNYITNIENGGANFSFTSEIPNTQWKLSRVKYRLADLDWLADSHLSVRI
jgi:hypothetical protein